MKQIKVLNKYKDIIPKDAVYIGRPSVWGNPFSHMPNTLAKFKVNTREEAVEAYKNWILTQPDLLLKAKRELCGKSLVCFCAPLACHGDVLVEIANETF